jgi:hypothetical protein
VREAQSTQSVDVSTLASCPDGLHVLKLASRRNYSPGIQIFGGSPIIVWLRRVVRRGARASGRTNRSRYSAHGSRVILFEGQRDYRTSGTRGDVCHRRQQRLLRDPMRRSRAQLLLLLLQV